MSVDYDIAASLLAQRLSVKGLNHCAQTAETAAMLAAIYGVDVGDARLAGLLHDWDREVSKPDLLAIARERGMRLNRAEELSPYLLHASLGAQDVAEALPGIGAHIVTAIERHTIGHPDMSELDMVIYVADMIEPGRSFKGVDDIREVAGTVSLRDLFSLCYRRSMSTLVDRRKPIHPVTVEVWNALVARERV